MKAWIVSEKDEFSATVVFAETRGKARAIAMSTDACEDADFCNIEVRRVPHMDKYYTEGKKEMDWDNPKERIALVKECGFRCDYDYVDWLDCKACAAVEYCKMYQDHTAEEGADNE